MKKLNLGCGINKSIADAVTIDINPLSNADIIHDLNKFPWPFSDNEFDVIYCMDVLEHLDDVVKVMEEIHRIAKPHATVNITVPHFSCVNAYTDPTHKHFFSLFSFDYFTGQNQYDFYTKVRFNKKIQLIFYPTFLNKLIWRIANRYPQFYERYLVWIFPAWFISVKLEVIK